MTLFKLILKLLHLTIWLYNGAVGLWKQTRSYLFSGTKSVDFPLNTDKQSLEKLPTHLGILLVEEEFSFCDLAKIVVWCMVLGITNISIYDRHGTHLVTMTNELFNLLHQSESVTCVDVCGCAVIDSSRKIY